MTPTLRHKVLVGLAALAAVVGIIDAAMAGVWDLVAVFSLVLLPMLGVLASLQWGRQVVPLRPDLVSWLRDRATLTGEPLTSVADRAVAAQRTALGEGDRHDRDPDTNPHASKGPAAGPP